MTTLADPIEVAQSLKGTIYLYDTDGELLVNELGEISFTFYYRAKMVDGFVKVDLNLTSANAHDGEEIEVSESEKAAIEKAISELDFVFQKHSCYVY